jgi:hypothetical protein
MANILESDLIERDELNLQLSFLEASIDMVGFGDGWSLRAAGAGELAYLRKSEGWTADQVERVALVLQDFEDLLFGRVEQIIEDLDGVQGRPKRRASRRRRPGSQRVRGDRQS